MGVNPYYKVEPQDNSRTIFPRPDGLPENRSMETFLHIPVWAIAAYNYSIEASIGLTANTQLHMLRVFATGDLPNLIRAEHLPEKVLRLFDTRRTVENLRYASSQKVTVLVMTNLTVRLG